MSYDNANAVMDAEVVSAKTVTTAAVAKVNDKPPPSKEPSPSAQAKSFDDLPILVAAQIALESGLSKKGESLAQVGTRISLGRDLKLGFGATLNGISISPTGAVIMSVAIMRLLINSSGRYKLRVTKRDLQGSTVEVFEKMEDGSWESCGVPISFGPEDAKRAKLDTKETYRSWPVDMYCNRATAAAFRTYTSDCARGVACYLPEEIDNSGYKTDVSTGDMVEQASFTVTTPTKPAAPKSDLLSTVQDQVKKTGFDVGPLLDQYGVKSLDSMTQDQLKAASRIIQQKAGAK